MKYEMTRYHGRVIRHLFEVTDSRTGAMEIFNELALQKTKRLI